MKTRIIAAIALSLVLAASTGTCSNQTFIFAGVLEPFAITLTNAYSGQIVSVSGTFNVNTNRYVGQGTGNTLLMTNARDYLSILNSSNQQTVVDVQRIITGNGDDVVVLDSTQVTAGDMTIFGGTGNELIWANGGNVTINAGTGTNNINGGPGNNIINGGRGNDLIYAGSGNNTISAGAGNDTIVYNVTQDTNGTTTVDGGTNTDTLVLQMTAAQADAAAADISAAQAFIAANSDPTSSSGPSYTFASFPLTFRNIEVLSIVFTAGVEIKGITSEGNNIRVTWQAAATKTNALQRSPGDDGGGYSNNFADVFIVTNNLGSVTNYLDIGAATNCPARYYRVRLVP